jgi:hypothetical protein
MKIVSLNNLELSVKYYQRNTIGRENVSTLGKKAAIRMEKKGEAKHRPVNRRVTSAMNYFTAPFCRRFSRNFARAVLLSRKIALAPVRS